MLSFSELLLLIKSIKCVLCIYKCIYMALSAFCCVAPLSEVLRSCINGACAPTCWVPGRTRLCCVVLLHHMWLWVNKASPGSPGCSDMFWARHHDFYSLLNASRITGWRIRSAISFYTKMTSKRWREGSCRHTNLILGLLIQTRLTTDSLLAVNKHLPLSFSVCPTPEPPAWLTHLLSLRS